MNRYYLSMKSIALCASLGLNEVIDFPWFPQLYKRVLRISQMQSI